MELNSLRGGYNSNVKSSISVETANTNNISNVMMSAFFQNSKTKVGGLGTDRRNVLDLFSLYAKTVRIIWTYDSTEFCCNADGGKCTFVTTDLDDFLQHAADTQRCESCDLHLHENCGNDHTLCEQCSSNVFCASLNNNSNSGSNNSNNDLEVLDMTMESKPKDFSGYQSVSPESQVKPVKRGRPARTNQTPRKRPKQIPQSDFEPSREVDEFSCSSYGQEDDISSMAVPAGSTSEAAQLISSESKVGSKISVAAMASSSSVTSSSNAAGLDEELVECNHCGRLLRKESLRTHIARRHENARFHFCQFCDYQSYDAYVMREHVRRHLGQYLFKCDLCPFQAVKKYQLDSHMRRHTGEKPFRCSLCSYACAWNVQLKSHMPIHEQGTEEERASRTCSTCGVLFSSTGTYNRHACFKHGRESSEPEVIPKQTKKRLLIAASPQNEPLAAAEANYHQPSSDNHDELVGAGVASTSSSPSVVLRKRSFRVPLVVPSSSSGATDLTTTARS